MRRRVPARTAPPTGRYAVHVRFSDVDVYGHVNNVKYYEYLQESRIVLIDQLVGDRSGFDVVVAQVDVDYVQPIRFRAEPYECLSWVTHVGNRAMSVGTEIRDGGHVLARATVVVVVCSPNCGPTSVAELGNA